MVRGASVVSDEGEDLGGPTDPGIIAAVISLFLRKNGDKATSRLRFFRFFSNAILLCERL